MDYAIHPHRNQVQVASGLDMLAGAWLFISPWTMVMSTPLAWSCWIVGACVAILGAIRAFGAYGREWISWINVALGAWVIFSPWIVADIQTDQGVTNAVITGIAIVVLAGWSAIATHTEQRDAYDRNEPPRV